MKTGFNLAVVFFLLCFIIGSCSNDDDRESPNEVTIDGEWNLINVQGSFVGVDEDFEKGTIVWEFDESDKILTVTNKNTITEIYDGLPSGTYPYAIVAPADADMLIVDEVNLWLVQFTKDSLLLDQLALDGFKLSFSR